MHILYLFIYSRSLRLCQYSCFQYSTTCFHICNSSDREKSGSLSLLYLLIWSILYITSHPLLLLYPSQLRCSPCLIWVLKSCNRVTVLCGHFSQLLGLWHPHARLPLVCGCHPTHVLTLCTRPLPCIEALLTPSGLHGVSPHCSQVGALLTLFSVWNPTPDHPHEWMPSSLCLGSDSSC